MELRNGLLDMRKCVMYDENKKKCTGLNELYCLTGVCSFFKTAEDVRRAEEKLRERREKRGYAQG